MNTTLPDLLVLSGGARKNTEPRRAVEAYDNPLIGDMRRWIIANGPPPVPVFIFDRDVGRLVEWDDMVDPDGPSGADLNEQLQHIMRSADAPMFILTEKDPTRLLHLPATDNRLFLRALGSMARKMRQMRSTLHQRKAMQ